MMQYYNFYTNVVPYNNEDLFHFITGSKHIILHKIGHIKKLLQESNMSTLLK